MIISGLIAVCALGQQPFRARLAPGEVVRYEVRCESEQTGSRTLHLAQKAVVRLVQAEEGAGRLTFESMEATVTLTRADGTMFEDAFVMGEELSASLLDTACSGLTRETWTFEHSGEGGVVAVSGPEAAGRAARADDSGLDSRDVVGVFEHGAILSLLDRFLYPDAGTAAERAAGERWRRADPRIDGSGGVSAVVDWVRGEGGTVEATVSMSLASGDGLDASGARAAIDEQEAKIVAVWAGGLPREYREERRITVRTSFDPGGVPASAASVTMRSEVSIRRLDP